MDYKDVFGPIEKMKSFQDALIDAVKAWMRGEEAFTWICVQGHDACRQMYACEECPYCEKVFHPAIRKIIDFKGEI